MRGPHAASMDSRVSAAMWCFCTFAPLVTAAKLAMHLRHSDLNDRKQPASNGCIKCVACGGRESTREPTACPLT
ncbi:hypothetical protein PF005_g33634, partial [Phytophthora fragariae]